MILVVAATEIELQAIENTYQASDNLQYLVSGVGLLATTYNLTKTLNHCPSKTIVVNIGIAGAYFDRQVEILDICLASSESLADFGIVHEEQIADFSSPHFEVDNYFLADQQITTQFANSLESKKIPHHIGHFNTVAGLSGTKERGKILATKHQAICENMEGAAVAMVCQQMAIPWVEYRVISNMVEDRNPGNWQITKACQQCSPTLEVLLTVLKHLKK